MSERLAVYKTYKLFIGGAFPRSESGRSYVAQGVNAAMASRKDARDAVAAARKGLPAWSSATAYNRGQVLYRVAEMLEPRSAELGPDGPEAVDRWVWYAGWCDKLAQVVGAANPVAGPYFDFSLPEPTGAVAVLAPQDSPVLGLVSVLAPVLVAGNTAVVVAAEDAPVPALVLAEVLATSDVPGGTVNILTGRTAEIAPVLAAHHDVDAIDLAGAPPGSAGDLERAAADNLKRVRRPHPGEDWHAAPPLDRMTWCLETKTVWHPTGV